MSTARSWRPWPGAISPRLSTLPGSTSKKPKTACWRPSAGTSPRESTVMINRVDAVVLAGGGTLKADVPGGKKKAASQAGASPDAAEAAPAKASVDTARGTRRC